MISDTFPESLTVLKYVLSQRLLKPSELVLVIMATLVVKVEVLTGVKSVRKYRTYSNSQILLYYVE